MCMYRAEKNGKAFCVLGWDCVDQSCEYFEEVKADETRTRLNN